MRTLSILCLWIFSVIGAQAGDLSVGDDGTVLKIDTAVNPKTSAQDMAATLGELGVAKRNRESNS